MRPELLARRFRYEGFPPAKGVDFTGAVFVDEAAVYLFHVSEMRSSDQAMIALAGAIGLLVQRFTARKRLPTECPFEVTPVDDLPPDVLALFDRLKVTPDSRFAMIDRAEGIRHSGGFLRARRLHVGDLSIKLAGVKGRVWRRLEHLGYTERGAVAFDDFRGEGR